MDAETYSREIVRLARIEASDPHAHLGGSVVGDLRRFLHTYADGKCAMCGGITRLDANPNESDRAEVSHVISVGDSKKGMGVGNVFNGCRACNLATSDKSLTPYLHLFSDIFAIPTEWPTRGQMAASRPKTDNGDAARIRRESLGFDF